MPSSKNHSPTFYGFVMAAVYVVIILLVNSILWLAGYALEDVPGLIRIFLQKAGVFGPLAMVSIFAISAIVPLPTATLSAVAGLFFGKWQGLALSLIGLNISGWILFYIARHLGGSWVAKSREHWVRDANKLLTEKGFFPIFLARLVLAPFDAVSIAAGLSGMPLGAYTLATLLGSLPSAIVLVLFGESLGNPQGRLVFGGIVLIVFALAYLLRQLPWFKKYIP